MPYIFQFKTSSESAIIIGFPNKNKMTKSKLLSRINSEYSYVRVKLTVTSRVLAGWAITMVGLVKLWQTEDPAAWWPILMGGTGLMIVSRGVDHYMNNEYKTEKDTHVETMTSIEQENPFQHADPQEYESYAVKKHKEYQNNLPV